MSECFEIQTGFRVGEGLDLGDEFDELGVPPGALVVLEPPRTVIPDLGLERHPRAGKRRGDLPQTPRVPV